MMKLKGQVQLNFICGHWALICVVGTDRSGIKCWIVFYVLMMIKDDYGNQNWTWMPLNDVATRKGSKK